VSLAAIRNGLFRTLTACGPWDETEISTCDFGIIESTSGCALMFLPGTTTITPNRNNNAPARGYLRAWGINGEAYLKDTGDPELVLSRVWQVHDDLYNTIRKDDTLNGAAFSSTLNGFSFDINTSGRDVNGQLFFVVGFGMVAEEIT
jgi:hypothetical protein